ncbi:MAG: hypothetical protein M1825_005549 [Sarcosagium campestre]|nr:MAG: hypothetical protein M1825_005549 [Sarcosagium campestre]
MPQWNVDAEHKLFLAILQTSNLTSVNWENVASALDDMGHVATASACRQHYNKIKRTTLPSAPSTPRAKGSAPRTPNSKPNSAGSKKRKASDEADDDEEISTPTKPGKLGKDKRSQADEKLFKSEISGDNEDKDKVKRETFEEGQNLYM